MTSNAVFILHPQSTLRASNETGVEAVMEGLRCKASLRLRANVSAGTDPVALLEGAPQWLMVETSGTSGSPKTIRRAPQSWMTSFEVTRDHYGLSPADTYATLGALSHSITLYATLEAFHIGGDLCPLAQLGPRRQADEIHRQSVTVLYATPSQLRLLAKGAAQPLPDMRYIFSGGGKLDADLYETLKTLCPNAQVIEFFGASETSFITIADALTPTGSVGRAYPNVELRIDASGADRAGDIWVKSPYLFDGYETGASQGTIWDGAYLNIGDIGYLDENGYLFLKGRKNRMVTIADKNVFPEEIEQLIGQMVGVESCAIVAKPDAARGHRLCCFVKAHGDLSTEALRQQCRDTLSPHCVPRDILFIEDMPSLAAGKPDLSKLQALLDD